MRAGGRHSFILAKDKNKKDHEKLRRKIVDHRLKQCETGRSQAANLETQNEQSGNAPITSKHLFPKGSAKMIDGTERPKIPSRNKQSGNAPITSKHLFPKGSAKMIDGTERPKIPSKFAKRAAR